MSINSVELLIVLSQMFQPLSQMFQFQLLFSKITQKTSKINDIWVSLVKTINSFNALNYLSFSAEFF